MSGKKFRIGLRMALAIFAATLFVMSTWAAAQLQEKVLYSFAGSPGDGASPHGVVMDAAGNLYGTASAGGTGHGTVFELTPGADGSWTEKVLHTFSDSPDGSDPSCPIIDAAGNLYGTTWQGGANGGGTVFELTPGAGGSWTEKVLHSFGNHMDGSFPGCGLVFDAAGNLYGTTYSGGQNGMGTVFELTPDGSGGWTEQVLHHFTNADGAFPYSGLIFDGAGNLYGTTSGGGWYNNGTVFELTPTIGGSWTESVLHSFNNRGAGGANPVAGLLLVAGNLYGTTGQGTGRVFELTPIGGGSWTETVLLNFYGADGADPYASLIFAGAGNLYGTTVEGGTYNRGTVFELAPDGRGGWTGKVLYNFGNGTDGFWPYNSLITDATGNLYSTTSEGGTYGQGTVFRLAPAVSTTTVLTTAPNPSTLGQAVTMTATVTAQNGSTPVGTVVFSSNGVQIGSVSLNSSGVAVLTYAGLPLGTDSLAAIYQGSATLAGSTSNLVMQLVGAAMTTVTGSPNPSMFGDAVTITATVSPLAPGGPPPTGTVSFASNGTAISGCTAVPLASSLTAACTTSTLAVGTDAIVATYSGDANYFGSSGTLAQLVNPIPIPFQFVAVTPCRLVDTRPDRGGSGPIQGGTFQNFLIPQEGGCNIPATAAAYSLNVSAVPQGPLGYLTIWPTGEGRPLVATLNSIDGRIKADAAIVPAGASGAVSIYVTQTTNVILDINGYFAPVSGSTLAFYPLTPCRVADTRKSSFPQGLGAAVFAAARRSAISPY